MKKIIITSFCFLIGSLPGYSDDFFKEDSPLKRGYGNALLSTGIEESERGIKVPLVQHSNCSVPSKVLLALKGKIPQTAVREVPELAQLMKTVGVNTTDPLLVVVQGYSGIPTGSYEPLRLKLTDYFSQNKLSQSNAPYDEKINVKAAVLGIESDNVSIMRDNVRTPYDFSLRAQNYAPYDKKIVSTSNNMAILGLYNDKYSTGFLGLYKGIDRTLNGVKQADNRGVAVIHVLLNKKDENGLSQLLGQIKSKTPTIGDVVDTLEGPFLNDPYLREVVDVIGSVIEKETKKKAQTKTSRKPTLPVKTPAVRKVATAPKATTTAVRKAATAPKATTTAVRKVTPTPKTTPTAARNVAPAPKVTPTAVRKPKAPTAVHKVATARRTTSTVARTVAPTRRTTSTVARTSSASARRAAFARQRLAARGAAIARQRLLAARGAAVTRQRTAVVRKAPVVRKRVVTARRAVARSRR